MVIVDSILMENKYPVELHYVAHLDQVWIVSWAHPKDEQSRKSMHVIEKAKEKRKHRAIPVTTSKSSNDDPSQVVDPLVENIFFPTRDSKQFTVAYVSLRGFTGLLKLDLKSFNYVKSVDLAPFNNCAPERLHFSNLC